MHENITLNIIMISVTIFYSRFIVDQGYFQQRLNAYMFDDGAMLGHIMCGIFLNIPAWYKKNLNNYSLNFNTNIVWLISVVYNLMDN